MKTESVLRHIVNWLADYCNHAGTGGFVVGVSGGIDSAVTSSLTARTGKPTMCVEMPIHQAESQVSRARKHIEKLESEYSNVSSVWTNLTPVFDSFVNAMPTVVDEEERFLTGTGNKVEDFGVGFYTKYGDGGVDLSPIADLNKTEVYELGREMNVIDEIMIAKPTDGLWGDDRSDEEQLGASYAELEWAMGFDDRNTNPLSSRQKSVLEIYNRLHKANKHKMEPIPVCEIPSRFK